MPGRDSSLFRNDSSCTRIEVWSHHKSGDLPAPSTHRSAGDDHGDRSNTAVATYCNSTQNSSDCTKGLMLRASVARVRLVSEQCITKPEPPGPL